MNLFAAAAAMLPSDAEIHRLLEGDNEGVHPLLQGGMFSMVTPVQKGGKLKSRRIIHRKRKANGKLTIEVEYAGYREINLHRHADKLFPLPPVQVDNYNPDADAVHPSIEDSGRPGTSARIDAYREWYDSQPTGACNPISPNEGILSDTQQADMFLISVLSLKPGEKEKERIELKRWMMELTAEAVSLNRG